MATTFAQQPPISQIALLHRVSNIVSSELSLDEMLGQILGLTVQVNECDACLVYLIEAETHEIVLRASQVPHAEDLGHLRMKMGEGVTGWVAEHKSVVALASDAACDARFKYFQALIEDTYEAFASVPLISGGEVVGGVNVHHRERHEHGPEEIALLTVIGEQMGIAVWNSMPAERKGSLPGVVETQLPAPIKNNPDWYNAYSARNALGRWASGGEMAGPAVFLAS